MISGYIYGDWGTQATCGTFTLEAGMTRGCYAPSEPYRGDQLGLSGVLHVNGEFQGWNEAAPAKH
ncbi:hypothetical protein [Streptomyces roseoviridis]|uniref:hypothetical protein n=1 Tax=Streptomyces roseoviridis TaxID=67361 RepID=UPI0031EB9F1C